jgi:hypothetical protein
MLVAFKPDFHSRWLLMAYHELDNCLSCLGCVTDWQQETRGLFLLPELAGHAIKFTRTAKSLLFYFVPSISSWHAMQ